MGSISPRVDYWFVPETIRCRIPKTQLNSKREIVSDIAQPDLRANSSCRAISKKSGLNAIRTFTLVQSKRKLPSKENNSYVMGERKTNAIQ